MLQLKANENFEAAQILHFNKKYNSVVHCAYYSCFQLMVLIHNSPTDMLYGKSSHEKLIGHFKNEIYKLNRLSYFEFEQSIQKLKIKRKIADYGSSEVIIESVSQDCINCALKVKNILLKNFKI